MTDRQFLIWLHKRLEHVHNEDPMYDYMHKLRAIIYSTPPGRRTPNNRPFNTIEDLEAVIHPE